jgi:hypothetical protein
MVERDFEADLERLFNQAPTLADSDAFADRVTRKLEKGWRLRALGIAAAGTVGGLIALSQMIRAGLNLDLVHASSNSVDKIDQAYNRAGADVINLSGLDLSLIDLSAIGLNANLFAMSALALLLAGAAMGVRMLDES